MPNRLSTRQLKAMQTVTVLAAVVFALLAVSAIVGGQSAEPDEKRFVVVQYGSDEVTCRGQLNDRNELTWEVNLGAAGLCDSVIADNAVDVANLAAGQTLFIHVDPVRR